MSKAWRLQKRWHAAAARRVPKAVAPHHLQQQRKVTHGPPKCRRSWNVLQGTHLRQLGAKRSHGRGHRDAEGARACAAGGGGAKSARVRRVMSAKTSGERNNSRQTPQAPLAPPSVLAGSPPIEHHHHHHRHCSLVWFIWLQLVWFGFNTHCQLLIISLFCYLLAKLFETCPPRSPWKQRTRASAITTRTRTRTGSRMCNKLQVRNLQ